MARTLCSEIGYAPGLVLKCRATLPAVEMLAAHGLTPSSRGEWQGCETYTFSIPRTLAPTLDEVGLMYVRCWRGPGSGIAGLRLRTEAPYPHETD